MSFRALRHCCRPDTRPISLSTRPGSFWSASLWRLRVSAWDRDHLPAAMEGLSLAWPGLDPAALPSRLGWRRGGRRRGQDWPGRPALAAATGLPDGAWRLLIKAPSSRSEITAGYRVGAWAASSGEARKAIAACTARCLLRVLVRLFCAGRERIGFCCTRTSILAVAGLWPRRRGHPLATLPMTPTSACDKSGSALGPSETTLYQAAVWGPCCLHSSTRYPGPSRMARTRLLHVVCAGGRLGGGSGRLVPTALFNLPACAPRPAPIPSSAAMRVVDQITCMAAPCDATSPS